MLRGEYSSVFASNSPDLADLGGRVDAATLTKTTLIHFDPYISVEERDARIAQMNGELVSWMAPIGVATVRLTLPDTGVNGLTELVGVDGHEVQGVEFDGEVRGTFIADDPDITDPKKVYVADLFNLSAAWDYSIGSEEVTVAVLDTGVFPDHPEFADRLTEGYDFVNRDDDPSDDHGHGTHIAGTVAAGVNNGIGTAGICPQCTIMPVKVLNENNAGVWSGVANGLIYAVDNGADIVVLSLGSPNPNKTMESAISYANQNDVLVIAAAGNENTSAPFYPAAYPGTLGVGATDQHDEKWALSNYGEMLDVMAPGNLIYSTYLDLENAYEGHIFMSGTSMATPHVAGLAGLLLSQDSSRNASDLKRLIIDSAKDLGEPTWDEYYGHGRIDIVSALKAETDFVPPTGKLSGLIWYDENGNGLRDEDEKQSISGIQVDVVDLDGNVIKSGSSNSFGEWRIEGLLPETYKARVTLPDDRFIVTSSSDILVIVTSNTDLDTINFGLVEKPSEDALEDVQISRSDEGIELTWNVTNDLVDSLTLERSTDQNTGYIVIQTTSLADATAAARNESTMSVSDTLPEELQHSIVYYRIKISPGDVYYGPLSVEPLQMEEMNESLEDQPADTLENPPGYTVYLPTVRR